VYKALAQLYRDHPEFRKQLEPFHSQLPTFMADAMNVLAIKTYPKLDCTVSLQRWRETILLQSVFRDRGAISCVTDARHSHPTPR
jgi:hypothetical protein